MDMCRTCKFFFKKKHEGISFEETQCFNEEISLDDYYKHFDNMVPGCKHYEPNDLIKEVELYLKNNYKPDVVEE